MMYLQRQAGHGQVTGNKWEGPQSEGDADIHVRWLPVQHAAIPFLQSALKCKIATPSICAQRLESIADDRGSVSILLYEVL